MGSDRCARDSCGEVRRDWSIWCGKKGGKRRRRGNRRLVPEWSKAHESLVDGSLKVVNRDEFLVVTVEGVLLLLM